MVVRKILLDTRLKLNLMYKINLVFIIKKLNVKLRTKILSNRNKTIFI